MWKRHGAPGKSRRENAVMAGWRGVGVVVGHRGWCQWKVGLYLGREAWVASLNPLTRQCSVTVAHGRGRDAEVRACHRHAADGMCTTLWQCMACVRLCGNDASGSGASAVATCSCAMVWRSGTTTSPQAGLWVCPAEEEQYINGWCSAAFVSAVRSRLVNIAGTMPAGEKP